MAITPPVARAGPSAAPTADPAEAPTTESSIGRHVRPHIRKLPAQRLPSEPPAAISLDSLLAGPPPQIVYQPIVDLSVPEHTVVGYEALARWTGASTIPTDAVFAAAATAHRIDELDWQCRLAALRGALDSSMTEALFVNYEPGVSLASAPAGHTELWARAIRELNVVVEITEREIARRPALLLAAVDDARHHGLRIALDDVGAHPDTLAMLELVRPDVVKLDLSLVQSDVDGAQARTLPAVLAYSERTGAAILAEGIETPAQLDHARSLGARYGQGHLFGRPAKPPVRSDDGRTPGRATTRGPSPLPRTASPPVLRLPFRAVAGHSGVRTGRRSLLTALARSLETHAATMQDAPVVLASFQHAAECSARTRRRFRELAARAPLVVAFGVDVPPNPEPGVRGCALPPDDALVREWVVVVLGPSYAAALLAEDCGDTGPDAERRFRYTLTQDRDTVVAAGRALLARLPADVTASA